MRKLSAFLSTIMVMLIGFSFAAPTILDTSYSIEPDSTIQIDGGEDTSLVVAGGDVEDVANDEIENVNKPTVTRTVIPAVPQTGPNRNVVGIIIATLVVFGGYIYIKKRADI